MNFPQQAAGVSKNFVIPRLDRGIYTLSSQKRGIINKMDFRLHRKPWIMRMPHT
jgi:hypothetical protein